MKSSRATGAVLRAARAARCVLGPRAAVWRGAVALVVAAGLTNSPRDRLAWGQDDWDAAKDVVRQPNEFAIMRVMPPAEFDRWVSGGKTTDQVQREMESLLALHVESAARMGGLSDAQKKKLALAGHGDMKRLSRNMDELKEKFRDVGQDQEKFRKIMNEVSLLRTKMQSDIFGESSLYRKTLKQTFTRDQAARYEEEEWQRRRFRYEARIELVMCELETTLPLRPEQRQRLVKLVLEETQPPSKFGPYDNLLVIYQLRKLGETKVRPLFDDAQWRVLKIVLDRSVGMEEHLRMNGALP